MIRTLEIASGLLANLGMALVVCSLILVPANFARAEEYFSCELTCNVNCNGTGECYQTYDCNSADKCKCNANQDSCVQAKCGCVIDQTFLQQCFCQENGAGQ